VGSGLEAEERARRLTECGARVRRASSPVSRPDVEGCLLVVCTGRDEATARAVRALADECGALLHCEDRPSLSDLALPAVVWRGAFTAALSTGGASPALAHRLREDLERILDERLGSLLERLADLRRSLAHLPAEERRARLIEAVSEVRLEGRLDLP
jgi:siroheme synthase-like protein